MDIIVVPIMTALEAIANGLAAIGIPFSFGFAIIIFTLAIKLVTAPLNAKQIKSAKAMQEMQPKLQELQKKFKDNKEELAKRQMELYKEAGVNPLGGCLPSLVQFPIWIGLYQGLFRLAQQGKLAEGFFWIPSLSQPTNSSWLLTSPANWNLPFVGAYIVLPILTIVTQILMQRMMTPRNVDKSTNTMNQAMMFMPLMFGFFAIQVPSGLALYWVTMNVFSMVQQYITAGWGSLAPAPKTAGSSGQAGASGSKKKDKTTGIRKATSAPDGVDPAPATADDGGPVSSSSRKGSATGGRKKRKH